jgi:PAS domain S-box-containing protein
LTGLQQARLLTEQKRVADELDQRVAQRTAELAAANEVLRKEVAERRRAEEALAASEESLRLIVDSIPGLVALLTPAGEVELVNPQLVEYTGRTLEELRLWGTSDTVHREDLPRVVQVFTGSITSGNPYDFETRIRWRLSLVSGARTARSRWKWANPSLVRSAHRYRREEARRGRTQAQ